MALAVPLLLSGCNITQWVADGATGGQVDVGGPSVPSDFPADVPLIEGEVLYGAPIGTDQGRGWNVTVEVVDVSAFDTVRAQLEGAGFAAGPESGRDPRGATGTWARAPFTVIVLVSQAGQDAAWVANYTVTEAEVPSSAPAPSVRTGFR